MVWASDIFNNTWACKAYCGNVDSLGNRTAPSLELMMNSYSRTQGFEAIVKECSDKGFSKVFVNENETDIDEATKYKVCENQ